MKKIGLVLFAMSFALMACQSEPTLTLMVGGDSGELDYIEQVLADFYEETGIEVELIRQSSDTEQRKQGVIVNLSGGLSDPDVMFMDVGWIGQIASSGWLEPLAPYGVDSSVFFPTIINLADTYDGELIAVPVYVDGGLLYYRTDLLEKYGYDGPPETWDELVAMAQDVQERERAQGNPDFWGFVWQGAQYEGLICSALEVFASYGGGFFTESNEPMLNDTNNVDALQFMHDLIHIYEISPPNTYTSMKEDEVRLVFENGNALFERNWPYAYGLHTETNSLVQNDVAIVPMPHKKGEKSASTLGGWHVGVSVFSDMKTNAVKLVEYLTSADVQKKFTLELGWNPGRMGVYMDEDVLQAMPHLLTFREVFINAIPRPNLPYYSEVSTVLQKNINTVLADDGTPTEMLDASQEEVIEIIAEYESE